MTNLIKNGEFYEGAKHWSVTHPEHVSFNEDDCMIASPGFLSQEIFSSLKPKNMHCPPE